MEHVIEVDRLAGSRMSIVVLGRQRFRVTRLEDSEPYYVAKVALYPMKAETLHERQVADAGLACF